MYKKFQLAVAVLCGTFAINIATTSIATASPLSDVLAKYCVPTPGNCHQKVAYKNGICDCENRSKFYSPSSRLCENCTSGSFATSDYKSCEPLVCPNGYIRIYVSNGNCPSGRILQLKNSSTCTNQNGYLLRRYNPDTKSF